jgi:CBS domain-containing protein
MATAKDLLKEKSTAHILSVTPADSLLSAMKIMEQHNIGALLVTEGQRLVGILSERDIVRKVELQGRTSTKTTVGEVMTSKVLYVEPGQSLEECMSLMNEKNIRHLPVMQGETLLGVISIRDVLREIIQEQKIMISQLEHYIRGS